MGQQGVAGDDQRVEQESVVHTEDWRNRPLQGGKYPYVYVDGIYLKRNRGGEYENVAILVAIAVNDDGYREVIGAAEGMKEDKASRVNSLQWLKSRGLDGVQLVVGDKCLGMPEAVFEVFPDAKYQRCTSSPLAPLCLTALSRGRTVRALRGSSSQNANRSAGFTFCSAHGAGHWLVRVVDELRAQ